MLRARPGWVQWDTWYAQASPILGWPRRSSGPFCVDCKALDDVVPAVCKCNTAGSCANKLVCEFHGSRHRGKGHFLSDLKPPRPGVLRQGRRSPVTTPQSGEFSGWWFAALFSIHNTRPRTSSGDNTAPLRQCTSVCGRTRLCSRLAGQSSTLCTAVSPGVTAHAAALCVSSFTGSSLHLGRLLSRAHACLCVLLWVCAAVVSAGAAAAAAPPLPPGRVALGIAAPCTVAAHAVGGCSLTQYCLTCSVPVCNECILPDSGSHPMTQVSELGIVPLSRFPLGFVVNPVSEGRPTYKLTYTGGGVHRCGRS